MIPAHWLTHTVTVEPYQGSGGQGPVFGPPVDVSARVEHATRLVRSDTGEEVVSSTTLWLQPGTVVPSGSKVTVDGRSTTALTVAKHTTGGLSGLDHVEVALA